MGPRFRGDDGFKADKLGYVILAQARTHHPYTEAATLKITRRENQAA